MNKIIAIVGMCGSGKSVACEYYEKRGYKSVYFGGITLEELKKAIQKIWNSISFKLCKKIIRHMEKRWEL